MSAVQRHQRAPTTHHNTHLILMKLAPGQASHKPNTGRKRARTSSSRVVCDEYERQQVEREADSDDGGVLDDEREVAKDSDVECHKDCHESQGGVGHKEANDGTERPPVSLAGDSV